jgi:nucleotide-binding universal stress UspA family protein
MKTILVPFRDDATAQAALDLACRAAAERGACIEGLFIQTAPLVYASEGIAIGGYVTQLADEELRRGDDARARFGERVRANGVDFLEEGGEESAEGARAVWRQIDGLGEQIVGEYGRVFDLIAIGRETEESSPDWNVLCEAALFESGRLLLLAPPSLPPTFGERIAVLWNGSTETARTVAQAMPLLQAAREVAVCAVEGVHVPGPDAEQIARCLTTNRINTSTHVTALDGRAPGHAVLDDAMETGPDMLIKGAYAQSRLRQMIFGGPTRHILKYTELPVLMGH